MEELLETGTVISIEDDVAQVRLHTKEKCGDCSSVFCGINEKGDNILTARTKADTKIGDNVTISIRGKTLVAATMVLYVVPMILLTVAIYVGIYALGLSELYSFGLALAVLGVHYLIVYFTGLLSKQQSQIPQIVESV
jgi:positive regulator of sigma E activity